MSRYFFDIHDVTTHFDDSGMDCATLEVARAVALQLLPDLTRDGAHKGDDRQAYTVLVTDEDHHPVYTATVSLNGVWLVR
ncbi:DUF6894 family protein [Methylobacterium mesophilicum]